MTVTIELSPEREAALQAQAQARGVTVQQLMLDLVDQLAPVASIAHLQKSNPTEWARHFDAWLASHDPNTPVLSGESMSRESIYPDRV